MKKIIYDFGSNNGDDLPYYLLKSDLVVAIEACPTLCETIRQRFSNEIVDNKLIVINCVATNSENDSNVDFYISRDRHGLSQFPKPDEANLGDFEQVRLPARSAVSIIDEYGPPHYVKIDIEHYDAEILRVLFDHGIRPPFISAESHSIEVFSLLVSHGHYNAFKLVNGDEVEEFYTNRVYKSDDGQLITHSFPRHSAGPFGEDIDGDWIDADNFYRLLAFEGLGWRDIHATNLIEPNVNHIITAREFYSRREKNKLRRKVRLIAQKTLSFFKK